MSQLIPAVRLGERSTRFVVLSQPRTGSSLLCGSIRWHPQILMHGELLNPYYGEELPREGAARFRTAMSVTTHDAVGCKLHACQPNPDCAEWEAAWDEMFADPTIRVVHLTRLDTLAQLASWRIADRLDRWGDQADIAERPIIRIDPAELAWFRRWNAMAYQVRLARLQRHSILPVTYEALRDQWQPTVDGVLRFLGVEPMPLDRCATQNETRPLHEVISNYHDLVEGA